jgi:hypothetical protein
MVWIYVEKPPEVSGGFFVYVPGRFSEQAEKVGGRREACFVSSKILIWRVAVVRLAPGHLSSAGGTDSS